MDNEIIIVVEDNSIVRIELDCDNLRRKMLARYKFIVRDLDAGVNREIQPIVVNQEVEPDPTVSLPIGYIFDNCRDVLGFCRETGLSEWCLKEGTALRSDTYSATLSVLQRYGLLTSGKL